MQRLDQPTPTVAGPRDLLRKLTRWLNLTLVQQATWPVVVLLSSSTMQRPAESSVGDVVGMCIGPLIAALQSVHFIRRRGIEMPSQPVAGVLASQARLILLGLPAMVLIGRMITESPAATLKVASLGVVSVAAYHTIHFGVVRDMFTRLWIPVPLFGLSWAIHQIADALARDTGGSYLLHAVAGFSVGVAVALASMVLHRWPGGQYTAPATHVLVIYMIFGFTT